MIRHHYTLEHVARELTSVLGSGVLVEAWTQEKFNVALVFAVGNQLRTFVIDVSPDGGTVSEHVRLRRARSNTRDMFRDLWGSPLALVTKHPDDRVLTLWFADQQIHCEFFSSGNGNVVATSDGLVAEALRDTAARVGIPFAITAPERLPLWMDQTRTVQQALARSPMQLGPWYAEEVCIGRSIATGTLVGELSEEQRRAVEADALKIQQACLGTATFYLLARADVRLLSLVPLSGWDVSATFTSVLGASSAALRERHQITALRTLRQQTLRSTTAELERLTRTLSAVTSDLVRDARSARYRMWADVLLTYPHQHERDLTSIDLADATGTVITIPLNPAHSIIENATRLYDKARAAEASAAHREMRIPELRSKIAALQDQCVRIEKANSVSEIEALLPRRMQHTEDQPRDDANGRFRFFALDEQHSLYVGKNAANNDELTMKFARQNDWWLHARGTAGSHAVLRGVEGDRVPKPILEAAAAITAYYSQARNASWVTVVYTQRKYVRKPKGSNVGAVVLEREQTVMVKPELPE